MVKILRHVQLLLHTRTVPSADADATSTDAANGTGLAAFTTPLLLARGVLTVPSPAAWSGLRPAAAHKLLLPLLAVAAPAPATALLRPRASRCTTSSLCPSRVLRHTKSSSVSHTLQHHTRTHRETEPNAKAASQTAAASGNRQQQSSQCCAAVSACRVQRCVCVWPGVPVQR